MERGERGRSRQLVALTGAGCSTESGIPDYRSPGGAWARHKPIYYHDFVRSDEVRRFYWARSFRGWPRFAAARPNAAHRALTELEGRGRLDFLITQNVDDLHQEAGSRKVVQLHGRNRVVICLDCRWEFSRVDIQRRLADSRIPDCERCGGILKPDVVFFGEAVPPARVALTVWSGFRFVKRAAERSIPIAIVNIGPTRGDDLATLKIEAKCGEALSAAVSNGERASRPHSPSVPLGELSET